MLILKESLFASINESFRFKIDDDLIRAYPLRGYTRLPVKQSLRDADSKISDGKDTGRVIRETREIREYREENLREIYTFSSCQTIIERWHQTGGFGPCPQLRGYYIASRSSLSGTKHSRNTVINFLLA